MGGIGLHLFSLQTHPHRHINTNKHTRWVGVTQMEWRGVSALRWTTRVLIRLHTYTVNVMQHHFNPKAGHSPSGWNRYCSIPLAASINDVLQVYCTHTDSTLSVLWLYFIWSVKGNEPPASLHTDMSLYCHPVAESGLCQIDREHEVDFFKYIAHSIYDWISMSSSNTELKMLKDMNKPVTHEDFEGSASLSCFVGWRINQYITTFQTPFIAKQVLFLISWLFKIFSFFSFVFALPTL